MPLQRPQLHALLLLLLTFLLVYGYTFDQKVDANGDNASYYLLAQGLANGQGYSNYYQVGNPPELHFPPGYPVIVALAMKTFGLEILGVKLLNGLLLLLSALLFFFTLVKLTADILFAWLCVALMLINPNLLRYGTIMMSEIPYLLVSLALIWAVLTIKATTPWFKDKQLWVILMLCVFAYYLRSIGVCLLVAVVAYLLQKRQWKHIAFLVSGFVFLTLPWYIRSAQLGGNSYIKQLLLVNPYRLDTGTIDLFGMLGRMAINAERYATRELTLSLTSTSAAAYETAPSLIEWIIGALIFAAITRGIWLMKSFRTFIFTYLISWFLIVLVWPEVWKGPRFIVPLIPLFIYFIMNTLRDLSQRVQLIKGADASLMLIAPVAVWILICYEDLSAQHEKAQKDYESPIGNYIAAAQWANQHTPAEAVFCCRKGSLFYLFSKRKVTGYRSTAIPELLIEDLREKNVDYLVLDNMGFASNHRYLKPAGLRYPDKFSSVFAISDPATSIMKFEPELGYCGQFDQDKENGFGFFRWSNGNCFEGKWSDGKAHGSGQLWLANGESLRALWEDGKPHGKAEYCDISGEILASLNYEKGDLLEISHSSSSTFTIKHDEFIIPSRHD